MATLTATDASWRCDRHIGRGILHAFSRTYADAGPAKMHVMYGILCDGACRLSALCGASRMNSTGEVCIIHITMSCSNREIYLFHILYILCMLLPRVRHAI